MDAMPRPLQLAQHFSGEELYGRYRHTKDPVERAHWQIIWLKQRGKTTDEIGETTGYSAYWIRTLIHRYNDEGEQGLKDRRHGHPGAVPMLSVQQQAELEGLLEHEKAPDGGPWTGPKVARWIERKTGRTRVHDQRAWDCLVRLGFSAQTPRPRHGRVCSGVHPLNRQHQFSFSHYPEASYCDVRHRTDCAFVR